MLTLHFPHTKDNKMECPVLFHINLNVQMKNTEYWMSGTVTRQLVGILDAFMLMTFPTLFFVCICN